jgi:hypothetical protein
MAPPDKGGIEYNVTAPRTQGKETSYGLDFLLRLFFEQKSKVGVIIHLSAFLVPKRRKDGK